MYTLNDKYPSGNTTIWYAKDLWTPTVFKLSDINKYYAKVGSIAETDLDEIFTMMQGEVWSPAGEARELIQSLGLSHTSMNVGDLIQVGTDYYRVDSVGFTKLQYPNSLKDMKLTRQSVEGVLKSVHDDLTTLIDALNADGISKDNQVYIIQARSMVLMARVSNQSGDIVKE